MPLNPLKSPKKVGFETYLSAVQYHEFDCIEKKRNLLSYTYYSKNMKLGKPLLNENITNKTWDYVAPETMGKLIWKTDCCK